MLVCSLMSLTACASVSHIQVQEGEAPLVQGPPARDNTTPLAAAYACMSERMSGIEAIGIGVGNVKDYTGRFSDSEGNTITQGGPLMVMSALGKLGDSVRMHERFDTQVTDLEMVYLEKRRLGDGDQHEVEGNAVPWLPYYGGTILESDYFIVGGITELNYNIQSGGAEFSVNQIGPKARTYTMNVAADLRIVDTRTLVVEKTVSMQKQIVGYEVGAGIFSFFSSNLIDLNAGAKNQEPLHLGVRTILELGVLELIAAVTDIDLGSCAIEVEVEPSVTAQAPIYKSAAPEQPQPALAASASAEAEEQPTQAAPAQEAVTGSPEQPAQSPPRLSQMLNEAG